MDSQVEAIIYNCSVCKNHDKSAKTVFAPLKPVPLTKDPWEKLAIDIVGPNENAPVKCQFAITLIDYYSKWPEVMFTSKVDTPTVIQFLKNVFSREGYCSLIATDDGVQFTSYMFEEFLRKQNITHCYSSLCYPQASDEIERFNAVFSNAVRTAILINRSLKNCVQSFLYVYRSTKHATTNFSPSLFLHSRQMRTGLDVAGIHNTMKNWSGEQVYNHVAQKQIASKSYIDEKRGAKQLDLNVGDFIRIRKPGHVSKGQMKYGNPVQITGVHGPSTYSASDSCTWNQSNFSIFSYY